MIFRSLRISPPTGRAQQSAQQWDFAFKFDVFEMFTPNSRVGNNESMKKLRKIREIADFREKQYRLPEGQYDYKTNTTIFSKNTKHVSSSVWYH